MEMNPVNWFEIYVNDMPRAKKFYETVLSKKLEKLESPGSMDDKIELYAFPMLKNMPGSAGALVKLEGVSVNGNNGVVIYFHCDDCAVEASRIEKAGGKVHRDKFSIDQYGYIVLAVDTEGNMFGLHSMK